ncbi:hypothetical protein BDW42DRAFT_34226 [Aspergillus taichungensis]|uniref:Uncharacterized protein n=1 Tax=Aspergillus taichungensis TaxID=482145 RepID=A0A2J5HF87_9EURO|nr:hypothetical protein BDW42DRAFT_34226 [Aspergillus taichungensis]
MDASVWDERGRRPAGPANRLLSILASSPESSRWKVIGSMETWNGSTPLDENALVQLPIATMRCFPIRPIRAAIDRHVGDASCRTLILFRTSSFSSQGTSASVAFQWPIDHEKDREAILLGITPPTS